MHITEFVLEEDNTYWEAFGSNKKEEIPIIKIRIILIPTGYVAVIRDYNTGYLLAKKNLTNEDKPLTKKKTLLGILKTSATNFANQFLNDQKGDNHGRTQLYV